MKNLNFETRTEPFVRLSGKIKNYKIRRESASFVFTKSDRATMGVVAIAAALVGLGGQATAVASNATALDEDADFVEFELDGNYVKGWLWRSPFFEGDDVNVAAKLNGDYFESFGISRPCDRMIALYPHCSRSISNHIKNAIKWWLISSAGFLLGMLIVAIITSGWEDAFTLISGFLETAAGRWFYGGLVAFIGVAVFSMTRQWMPFARVAEKVFIILDLPSVASIDLVKSSKGRRLQGDKAEFGSFYFRY